MIALSKMIGLINLAFTGLVPLNSLMMKQLNKKGN